MNSLYVVQLEAKSGVLAAVIEEERPDGGRNSRRIEIALRTASPQQRLEWRRKTACSALGLYRLLAEAGELTIQRPDAEGTRSLAEAEAREDGMTEASRTGLEGSGKDADAAERSEVLSAFTELPFDDGQVVWELAASETGGGPEAAAVLQAAAEAVRTRLAFGLTLAGVEPGQLAREALAAWSEGWEDAGAEAAVKSASSTASESGGREIAEWIASAAEKGLLHEHGRLPDEPKAAPKEAAKLQPSDFSLLPDAAPAEAALAELRRAMHARFGG